MVTFYSHADLLPLAKPDGIGHFAHTAPVPPYPETEEVQLERNHVSDTDAKLRRIVVLIEHGWLLFKYRRFEDAISVIKLAVDLCRTFDNGSILTVVALKQLGDIEAECKRWKPAEVAYVEAVALARTHASSTDLARILNHLGTLYYMTTDFASAWDCHQEAVALYEADDTTSPLDLADAVRGFAMTATATRSKGIARSLWLLALSLYQNSEITEHINDCAFNLRMLDDWSKSSSSTVPCEYISLN